MKTLYLENVEYDPAELGTYLSESKAFEACTIAMWSCDTKMLNAEHLQIRRDHAGEALSVLRLDLVAGGEDVECGCLRRIGSLQRRYYYSINADRLTALALDYDLSMDVLILAVCHEVDTPSWRDSDELLYSYPFHGSLHQKLKRAEEPGYLQYLAETSNEELCERAKLKEQILKSTSGSSITDASDRTRLDVCSISTLQLEICMCSRSTASLVFIHGRPAASSDGANVRIPVGCLLVSYTRLSKLIFSTH